MEFNVKRFSIRRCFFFFRLEPEPALINLWLARNFQRMTDSWFVWVYRRGCGVSWDRVSESEMHSASTMIFRVIDFGRPYAFYRDFCSQHLFIVVGSLCVRSASSMRIRQLVVLTNKHLFVRWCVSERGSETHNWRLRWCSPRELACSLRAHPIWWAKLQVFNF